MLFLKYEKVVVIERLKLPNVYFCQKIGDSQMILKLLLNNIFFLGLKPKQWCHASILMRQKIACDKLIVGKI